MAKYRGDYYTIDRDEREIGGELTVFKEFDDWKEAKAAWEALPEPEDGCFWLGRVNRHNPDTCETIACKGPDRDPLFDAWNEAVDQLVEEGKVTTRGKKILKGDYL